MKTANDLVKEMEASNLLMSNEHTFNEYVTELKNFQDMLCKMIAKDEYYEGMRINEALVIIESTARKYGLRSNQTVHKGILTMKELDKEIAIAMSGAKGEHIVANTLTHLNRPNIKKFQNMYISDGVDETELDNVILTDSGIIILEVKNVKYNITLTPEGRMVFNDEECFGKKPLGEKMDMKRRLLKSKLEKIVADKELNIPIHIDSFIVFCPPKGARINVNDQYHKEKFCFHYSLNKKIETYFGCASYNDNNLAQLNEILSEMKSDVKRFESKLNFNEVRLNIAETLAILQNAYEIQSQTTVLEEKDSINPCIDKTTKIHGVYKTAKNNFPKMGYAAGIVSVLIISGILVALTGQSRRR